MPDPVAGEAAQRRRDTLAELELRAVAAWRNVVRHGRDPVGIEVLQHEKARTLFRLRHPDDASADRSVVAKRCATGAALRERAIYADVLPRLPFRSLRLHGLVSEPDGRHAWLLIEDADAVGRRYDPQREEHRLAAGRWLGAMHAAAAALAPPHALGDRGPQAFREDLERACVTLAAVRANRAFAPADVAMLDEVASRCRLLASHWDEIERFCGGMRRTLVHGDFKEDHIRVRADRGEPSLLLFDWGEGGWGVPVLDAAKLLGYSVRPDLSAYHAAVGSMRPALSLGAILRLSLIGDACRCIASIRWEAEKLRHQWVERPLSALRVYSEWIDDLVEAEPWAENAGIDLQPRLPRSRTWF